MPKLSQIAKTVAEMEVKIPSSGVPALEGKGDLPGHPFHGNQWTQGFEGPAKEQPASHHAAYASLSEEQKAKYNELRGQGIAHWPALQLARMDPAQRLAYNSLRATVGLSHDAARDVVLKATTDLKNLQWPNGVGGMVTTGLDGRVAAIRDAYIGARDAGAGHDEALQSVSDPNFVRAWKMAGPGQLPGAATDVAEFLKTQGQGQGASFNNSARVRAYWNTLVATGDDQEAMKAYHAVEGLGKHDTAVQGYLDSEIQAAMGHGATYPDALYGAVDKFKAGSSGPSSEPSHDYTTPEAVEAHSILKAAGVGTSDAANAAAYVDALPQINRISYLGKLNELIDKGVVTPELHSTALAWAKSDPKFSDDYGKMSPVAKTHYTKLLADYPVLKPQTALKMAEEYDALSPEGRAAYDAAYEQAKAA